MEYWARFNCILTKNIFWIVYLLDYCNYFDVFQYGLLYSENVFLALRYISCKSEEMQSDRAQFMTNSANGCRKDMLIFCIFYLLCLASHNAYQYLPLLFQRKRIANIYIFALILHVISKV